MTERKNTTMRIERLLAGWTACLALAVTLTTPSFGQGSEAVSDPLMLDWKVLGAAGDVLSGSPYTLRNVQLNQSIRYGDRGSGGGINLVWDKSAALENFRIESNGSKGTPIKYGDVVALWIKTPYVAANKADATPYLRYLDRNFGINLTWSKTPIYEWVVAGGKNGEPLKVGDRFALFNKVEKDVMIYAKRPYKQINLRWYLDRDKGDYGDQARSLLRKHITLGNAIKIGTTLIVL